MRQYKLFYLKIYGILLKTFTETVEFLRAGHFFERRSLFLKRSYSWPPHECRIQGSAEAAGALPPPAEGVKNGGGRDPAQDQQRLQHDLPEW